MSVKEIQFLNRDFCTLFSKPFVYLHYLAKSDKYPEASYQYVLKREPFDKDSTEEGIIKEFKDNLNRTINASKLCRKLVFVHDFQMEYSGIIDDIETYPNFTCKSYPISNGSDSMPDCSVVWEINKISPKICGMLFENLISHVVGIDDKCFDLSAVMTSYNSNIPKKTLEGVIERNFLKRGLSYRGKVVRISDKNLVYVGDDKLSEEHFVSLWHYLVYLSLRHFIKRDLHGEDLEDCLKILDYINMNINYMEDYYEDMMNSTLARNLRNETRLEHGKIFRTSRINGEVDFISDNSIVDIKAYKTEDLPNWFAQLYLYDRLANEENKAIECGNEVRRNLIIVNVYSNLIYEFEHE